MVIPNCRPQPINAIPRPKGLGLGADRSMLLKKTGQVNNGAKEQGKELQMKTGAYCVIEKGKQDGMYGQVCGMLYSPSCCPLIKLQFLFKSI